MSIEFEFDAQQASLIIRGDLTINHAAEAIEWFRRQDYRTIDLAGINELDSAGLQLLLAARHEGNWKLGHISAAVADVLQLAGCENSLGASA